MNSEDLHGASDAAPSAPAEDSATASPYLITDAGLYWLERPGDPDSPRRRISAPIKVVAYARAPESDGWGQVLTWHDPDGKEHEYIAPLSALQGDGLEVCRVLADRGLRITSGFDARQKLIEYLASSLPALRITMASTTGWHSLHGSQVFVLPDRTIGDIRGCEEVRFATAGALTVYAESGTVGDWRTHVAALCAGNSRLLLSVATAFAAVLLHFSELDGGGIHLLGASSSGKTTAGLTSVSVFGSHRQMQRWRATGNGIEAIAAMYNSLLLVLDELGQVEPREAGEIAYMLANGQGKQRAIRTGGAARRQNWRLLFLSTGEIGLSQHMATVGKQVRAGQEVRLVELQADAGKGHGLFDQLNGYTDDAALSEALRAATRKFHGAVGLEFIRRAVDSAELLQLVVGDRIRKFVEECKAEFTEAGEFGGQAHRVCERFGLAATAGEFATEWDLTGLPPGEFQRALKRCFGEWLTARGTAGNAEPAAIVNTLRAFISRHEEARFTAVDAKSVAPPFPSHHRTVSNRAGWIKSFDKGREYLIDVDVFKKEIFAGYDVGLVCRVLSAAGCLISAVEGSQIRYALQRHVGTEKRRRVYLVTDKIWDDDQQEFDAVDADPAMPDADDEAR
ncbi:DUF927 domain-containing protein [Variovorax boronicumulans]|nr:DUF927 domain-containing protein [Variovorax boronicumulans]